MPPSHWRSVALGEVCEGIFDGPHATPQTTPAGPVFLGISNLDSGRLDLADTRHVSEEDFHNWTRRVTPRADDVVFSYETRLGQAALIPDNFRCCLGRRMGLLRVNRDVVDPRFLLYLYLGPDFQETIRLRTVQGSTVDRILLKELPEFPVHIPPLAEQRWIAEMLGALDARIDVNVRAALHLDHLAAAIFKEWFVDFGPTQSKHQGDLPRALGARYAAAFPSDFAQTTLGPIPAGWEAARLGTHITVRRGVSYKSTELEPSTNALVSLKAIQRGGGFNTGGLKPYTGAYKRDQVVAPGELVVAYTDLTQAADVIGKPALIPNVEPFETLIASLDVAVIRPASARINVPFVYYLLRSRDFQDHAYGYANGSTVLHLNKEALPGYVFALPSRELVVAFGDVVGPMLDKIEQARRESTSLAAMRSTLLPRLLTGEVAVPEATSLVTA